MKSVSGWKSHRLCSVGDVLSVVNRVSTFELLPPHRWHTLEVGDLLIIVDLCPMTLMHSQYGLLDGQFKTLSDTAFEVGSYYGVKYFVHHHAT